MMRNSSYVLLWMLTGACTAVAASGGQRVDISPATDRRDHLSANHVNWRISPAAPATITLDGVKLTLHTPAGSGEQLAADWWKAGLVDEYDAVMASDGAYVDGPDAAIVVTIRGLDPGSHSLATFHNSLWDELGPIDVHVNGRLAVSGLQPTHRATNDADAASAYVEFDVAAGDDAVVEIRPHQGPSAGRAVMDRIVLNGLELDEADPKQRAAKPSPASGDEHAPKQPVLTWQPAASAIAHDVYLGTAPDALAAASRSSAEYLGRVTEPKLETDADDHFATYYWRVDQVHEPNPGEPETITRGDVWRFRVRRLAFPGAEGYGRFARGGRGGRVIKVTNLNDSGPGSFRAAVEAEGPRTVIFDVGGLITLESKLVIRNGEINIAGQTAPGKGICIRGYNFGAYYANDVIIRYLRLSPGDITGETLDGTGLAGCDHAIMDHCSIRWSLDEGFSSRGAKNMTLQRTLISEALNVAGHRKYEEGKGHGYAASIGGDIGSFHHNLLANCAGRNWSLAGGLDKASRHTARLDIRNNVVYNWVHRTTDGGAMQVQFVNNYYKPGPATRVFHVLKPERNLIQLYGPQDYYVAGNVMRGHYGANKTLAGVVEPREEPLANFLVDEPFFEPHVTTQTAEQAYRDVLADVGCNVPVLDDHDHRVIEETRRGRTTYKGSVTGLPGIPDSQEDVGGWEDYPEVRRPDDWDTDGDGLPDWWEKKHGLNPNSPSGDFSDANDDRTDDGYSNLEEYLNWIVTNGGDPH